MPSPVETLSSLHTTLIDAVKGYDEGASIAKRDEVGGLCKDLKTRHMASAHAIAGLLLERGERPSADGSFMSTVHKLVLNTRFLLSTGTLVYFSFKPRRSCIVSSMPASSRYTARFLFMDSPIAKRTDPTLSLF